MMKKRLLSLLLVFVMVLGMVPLNAMATEASDVVYIGVSYDGQFQTDAEGAPLAYTAVPLSELEKIDLDIYGLSDYKYDADNDGSYEITALHLFIYVHEVLCGQDWSNITVSGGAGSIFFESGLFAFPDHNLNYYYNGVYPIDEAMTAVNGYATGATADHIVLKNGDYLDVAGFSNDSCMIYSATFRYFSADGQPVKSYSATAGEALNVNICTTEQDWSTNETVFVAESDTAISYSQTLLAEDALTVNADAEGNASITFDEPGPWYLWSYGYNDGMVSCTPAFATVEVTGGTEQQPTEPDQTEPAGQFALMAVNGDGFVIEPCYVTYAAGATVKEALKTSGYDFGGIDSGFISSVNGVVDNFSLHYDGDGYSLDGAASGATALWFTTNSSQVYSDDLLNLVSQMAKYNTSTSGVKNYAAAQEAYTAAADDFLQTSNAKALYEDLKAAMDAYAAFGSAEKVALTMNITQGDSALTTGEAVFTSEFGTEHTFTDFNAVALAPAAYDFDISDGTYRHVRGSITVAEGTTLTATVPSGTWISSLQLGTESYFELENALTMTDVTESSAIFYMLDSDAGKIYPYAVPAEGLDTSACKLYYRGYSYARTWESNSGVVTATYTGLKANSLVGTIGVFEAVMADGDYEQYQTFTCNILRVPTLESLTIKGDGSLLNTSFDSENAVTTTSDSVDILATALCDGVTVQVNGVTGTQVNVPLSGCTVNEDGSYKIEVVLTADNGQSNTYTVNVTKVDAVAVTVTHDADVAVEITNAAGSVIAPIAENNGTDTYKLVPGEAYTWLATKNTYYHTTASFTAAEGLSIAAATPKTEDWGTDIAARTASAATSQLTPDSAFTAADHTYVFTVESNTAAMRILAASKSTSTYTTTVYYTSHDNSNYSSLGGTNGPKDYTVSITSNTSYKTLANVLAVGGWGNSLRIEYKQTAAENGVTYYQDYFVDVVRSMTLNAMSATDQNNASLILTQKGSTTTGFAKQVYDYTAVIASGARQMNLTLKLLSSYKYDHGYTVTVACGDWSQTVAYSEALTPNTAQTIAIPLSGTVDAETITVTVSHEEESSIAGVYTIEVTKLPPITTTFAVTPADAIIFLTEDSTGNRIYPEAGGTYILNTEASYTYVITKNGYVGQSASFVAGEDNKTVTVTLTAAPETTLKDISQPGDWLQFRADDNNNGVVDTMTPIKAEDAVLEWANKIGDGFDSGATGCPIIVGGYIYTYAGNSIIKVNKDTGEVVKSGTMIGSSSFAISTPTYADGMLFVALSGGRVQAFNADTLEALWVFTDARGGQPNCPIVYCDGYVYTGFWNSETKQANYVCLSVADEDTIQTAESKLPTWTYTHNGFYWAGAYACEDFLLIGTDDGAEGYTKGYASILSLDPKTGVLLDEEKLTNVGDQRSSICYDETTDAYYFTTKGGDFYQIKVNADGTFADNSLRRLHLDNGTESSTPMSTSTPTIYNGRAYVGVSGTGQFAAYSGHNMTVIDLETFSIAYSVPTMGYPQTSGLLTTAYEDTDGYVYVYFVDNFTPGMIRVIRDKKGMTEVDHSYTSTATVTVNGESKTIETGYILFSPYGDEAQYAICSPITDSEGNLYFKNDTARLMRLSSRLTELEVTQQPEKLVYEKGMTFDGTGLQVTAHYANGVSKDISPYLSYTTEPLTADDTEITVSFDPDKLFESVETEVGGYWQWYQDVDGEAGQTYYLPTATVTVEIREDHTWDAGEQTQSPTCTEVGCTTYTCSVCGNSYTEEIPALGHSYENGTCTVCGATDPDKVEPTITGSIRLHSAALNLKEKVSVVYYAVNDLIVTDEANVAERGVLLYESAEQAAVKDPTQAKETVILEWDETEEKYVGQSEGIDARDMDVSQFAVAYLKLTNGDYIYGTKNGEAQGVIEYSPLIYCQRKQNDSLVGNLCHALMHYGAAAQEAQYGMTTGLMNEGFGEFTYDASVLGEEAFSIESGFINGMKLRNAALDLRGAISYIIRFEADESVAGKELYAEYSLLGETNSIELVLNDGLYEAIISGVPAKDLGATLRIKAYYVNENGEKVYGGELVYSGYEYIRRTVGSTSANEVDKELAKALAMYIYHADVYGN